MKKGSIKIKKGSRHDLLLENMASAGFSIIYSLSNEQVASVTEMETIVPDGLQDGDPVKVHFSITALHTGVAKITFNETQEWDKDYKPIPIYELDVTVI